jgi:hypothetical protein
LSPKQSLPFDLGTKRNFAPHKLIFLEGIVSTSDSIFLSVDMNLIVAEFFPLAWYMPQHITLFCEKKLLYFHHVNFY